MSRGIPRAAHGERCSSVGGADVSPALRGRARLCFAPRGTRQVLRAEQWVRASVEECFSFFADAANLEALTPPFLEFHVLTPLPVEMRVGALIEYRLRLSGVPLRWLTHIEDWRPGRGFTDVQLRGPYAHWVHRHEFHAADGGTWVCDEVEYALPRLPFSSLVHDRFVRPRLYEIFSYRRGVIQLLLDES